MVTVPERRQHETSIQRALKFAFTNLSCWCQGIPKLILIDFPFKPIDQPPLHASDFLGNLLPLGSAAPHKWDRCGVDSATEPAAPGDVKPLHFTRQRQRFEDFLPQVEHAVQPSSLRFRPVLAQPPGPSDFLPHAFGKWWLYKEDGENQDSQKEPRMTSGDA